MSFVRATPNPAEVCEASPAPTSCEGRREHVDLCARMPEEHGEGAQQLEVSD
jgi:hypothetical protein